MIGLEDTGRDMLLTFEDFRGPHQSEVRVIMVVKAPRGTIALFDHSYVIPHKSRGDQYLGHQHNQCEGIKAFMEEHSYDETKENTNTDS